ncbi:hypothetical protein WMF27_14625 [Sorangium sp. So ce281]|uniref:hypothetical protein n=1 Tax=unclassified Sorangium TaxID=2621164 RepID=UPI003F62BA36
MSRKTPEGTRRGGSPYRSDATDAVRIEILEDRVEEQRQALDRQQRAIDELREELERVRAQLAHLPALALPAQGKQPRRDDVHRAAEDLLRRAEHRPSSEVFAELRKLVDEHPSHAAIEELVDRGHCARCARRLRRPDPSEPSHHERYWSGRCPRCYEPLRFQR